MYHLLLSYQDRTWWGERCRGEVLPHNFRTQGLLSSCQLDCWCMEITQAVAVEAIVNGIEVFGVEITNERIMFLQTPS